MKIPANVIDQLVNGAQSDIRQVLNMLSTWKLSSDNMDFDEGKSLQVHLSWSYRQAKFTDANHRAKMNEKFSIMTPFDIINKMLGPYMFSNTSRETLGDKMELYFHDHSFVPLFIQVSCLKMCGVPRTDPRAAMFA
jgi:replication factor C subunit 1